MVKVLGFTGLNASGKSTAARIMTSKGFNYTSLSDVLREKALEKGLDDSRDNLRWLGNELREEFGSGALGKMAAEKIMNEDTDYVVDSIRNPAEVDELRKIKGFVLVEIKADPEIRFKRASHRGRNESASDINEFLQKEKKEMSSKETGQQLHKCMEIADISVSNEGTLDELRRKIESI
ncbi:MAG: AAA family ATPase [Nanobdellota archaeon]